MSYSSCWCVCNSRGSILKCFNNYVDSLLYLKELCTLDYVTTKKISFKKGVISKTYKVTKKVYIQKYFESSTDFYPYGAKAYFYLNQLKGSK